MSPKRTTFSGIKRWENALNLALVRAPAGSSKVPMRAGAMGEIDNVAIST